MITMIDDIPRKINTIRYTNRVYTASEALDLYLKSSGARTSNMDETGYFPPLEDYRLRQIAPARPVYVPPPQLILPTQQQQQQQQQHISSPVFRTEIASADMSEAAPSSQACSCPILDPCILETLALLQGSLGLLRELSEQQHNEDAQLSALLAQPCRLKMTIMDLLPLPEECEGTERALSSLLLRRDTYRSTPATPDLCSYVRCRLDDFLLDPVDALAPMQHCLSVLLNILDFDTLEFRAHLRRMKTLSNDNDNTNDIDLMCRAYDHLAKSTPKVFRSQFGEKLNMLEAAVEGLADQIALADDVDADNDDDFETWASSSHGEIVETTAVASTKRFSCTVAKLITIPRSTACV